MKNIETMETFLLDKKFKHLLEIINEISKQPTSEIAFSELESNLGLTQKTIKVYLDTLLDYYRQRHLEIFSIQKGKVIMSNREKFNIFELYHYFMKSSVKFQIMIMILKDPQISFTDLYLDLALSKSNASVHLKQLNDFLKQYQCKISFLQKNVLQGKAHQIRFLYYNILWGLDPDKVITTSPKLEQLTALLLEIVPEMPYITLEKIRLGFRLSQVFTKAGRFIESEKPFIFPDSHLITFEDFFQKIDAIDFLNHCPDLQTKQKECRYLYFLFCRANILTLEYCEEHEAQITLSSLPSVQYFIAQFQEKSCLALKAYEIKYLSYNLSLFNQEAALFRGRVKTFDLDHLIADFNNTSVNDIPELLEKFIKHLRHDNQEIKSLIQNFPSLSHYYTMLMRILITKRYRPIKLLVQSSISSLHRQSLIAQIANSTSFPIAVYTSQQLNGEKPDGIISNWLPEKKYQDVPFFSVSLFYTNWHKGDLEQFLKQLKSTKKED